MHKVAKAVKKLFRYFSFLAKETGIIKDDFKHPDIFSKIAGIKTISGFHGYECASFIFKYRECKLVRPVKPAKGNPWVLRARIWELEPQTDIALLAKGFHVAYCDVRELYGNVESVEIWNSFYDYMQKLGFSRKVAIESISRGSFYAYNWALQNGQKVSCIYADNPPLDFKSWPGGMGKGRGSKQDWKIFKKMHHLKSDLEALGFRNSPLDNAALIARFNFPILHVCGEEDEFAPIEENTLPFQEIILKNGGRITVILKPGARHNSHSLKDPTPIVDFILKATTESIKNNVKLKTPSIDRAL